ncbi:uncharacterized protein LOC130998562 [Salvia miltiorrhiza]|uniref:uncharacterized protein LOC130998562 n=1 Tax=Salvia miltiorrhiza TaxID=226208 RepID=UPI0025ABF1C1|nr:uncharacterized protein LOC130998562 [Salvia miltiorrhiza]
MLRTIVADKDFLFYFTPTSTYSIFLKKKSTSPPTSTTNITINPLHYTYYSTLHASTNSLTYFSHSHPFHHKPSRNSSSYTLTRNTKTKRPNKFKQTDPTETFLKGFVTRGISAVFPRQVFMCMIFRLCLSRLAGWC